MNLLNFQFMQEKIGKAVLCVVPANGFSERDVQRMYRNLRLKFDGQLTFVIETVEAIPFSPRGKAVYVNQRIEMDRY